MRGKKKKKEKIYSALLQCIEHCSTRKSTCRLPIYIYIYIYTHIIVFIVYTWMVTKYAK